MPLDLTQITVKSKEEIVSNLSEIIHRHRRSYIRKHTRPCPINCAYASVVRKGVTGCTRCDSVNPENCRNHELFGPMATKEQIVQEFKMDLRDPRILQHEYRDIMVLLWVLGQFDGDTPQEQVIASAEQHQRKD